MSCVFCEGCPDSHEHLFFTCPFSREVWRGVKREFGLYGFPESWDLIMLELNGNRGPGKIIQKLALSATIYFIWRERNYRIFKNSKQVAVKVFITIREAVMERRANQKVSSRAI